MIEKQEEPHWVCPVCGYKLESYPCPLCGHTIFSGFTFGRSTASQLIAGFNGYIDRPDDNLDPLCPICFSGKMKSKYGILCSNPDCLSYQIESEYSITDDFIRNSMRGTFISPDITYYLTSSLSPMIKEIVEVYKTESWTIRYDYRYRTNFNKFPFALEVLSEVWKKRTGIEINQINFG